MRPFKHTAEEEEEASRLSTEEMGRIFKGIMNKLKEETDQFPDLALTEENKVNVDKLLEVEKFCTAFIEEHKLQDQGKTDSAFFFNVNHPFSVHLRGRHFFG